MHYDVYGNPSRQPGYGLQVRIRETRNGYHVSTTHWPEEDEEEDMDYLPPELLASVCRRKMPKQAEFVFSSHKDLIVWLSQQLEGQGA